MKNPLEQFLPVEERADGVYVKIDRQSKEKIVITDLIRALDDSLVINYDRERLADILQRARGGFERLGPAFEYYVPDLERFVEVAFKSPKAFVKVQATCVAAGIVPTVGTLKTCLARKGVRHGVKADVLKMILDNAQFDTLHEIAVDTPAVAGSDAEIRLSAELSMESRPQLRTDGSVDYRNIQTFTAITQGQVLATKIPATAGRPGITVAGEPITPDPGNDKALPVGRNTETAKDGISLIASKSGILNREGDILHVVELLQIPGDINFSVGNIKYSGDVVVNGSVLPGFTVEAEGDIHIKGDVESARIISRNGAVRIDKGVIGKSDTLVMAKKDIHIAFAQETRLESEANIVVEKYALHCDCVCESFQTRDSHASVIGGHIKAERFVEVGQLGSEKTIRTVVELFDKSVLANQEKLKELGALEAKLAAENGPVERQLKTKAALLKKADTDISNRNRDEVKKWLDAHNTLKMKIKYVQQKIEETRAEIANPKSYDGYILAKGILYPGSELRLYNVTVPITSQMANKRFRLCNNVIETGD